MTRVRQPRPAMAATARNHLPQAPSTANRNGADCELRGPVMPLLLVLLLVLLIAQIGFWDTLGAVLGAAAMIVLLVILAAAVVALLAYMLVRRFQRG